MDSIGQPQALLNSDVFGLLLLFLRHNTLLKLALACRAFSKDFIWKRFKSLNLERLGLSTQDDCPMEIVKRLASLPDDSLQITVLYFDSYVPNAVENVMLSKFLNRIAPRLTIVRSFQFSFISLLDPSKLVSLDLSSCSMELVLPLLRAGCPNLKNLRLFVDQPKWFHLQESFLVVSQWKDHLEKLQILTQMEQHPPGFLAAIRAASISHLKTLKRLAISAKAHSNPLEDAELIFGPLRWDSEAYNTFERNALAATGLPIRKLRFSGSSLFLLICWARNRTNDFSSREQIEKLWNICGETKVSTCAKILSSALDSNRNFVDRWGTLTYFIFDKTLELINGVAWTSAPKSARSLVLSCYLFLLTDTSESRSQYLTKFESLVDGMDAPDEPLVHFSGRLYFISRNPRVIEQLLTKSRWRQHFSAFFNGTPDQRPLVFDYISRGDAIPFIESLLPHVQVDPKVTNVDGVTVFEHVLRQSQDMIGRFDPFSSLAKAFLIHAPQVIDDISIERLQYLVKMFPQTLGQLPARRIFRRQMLDLALEQDDVVVKLYNIFHSLHPTAEITGPVASIDGGETIDHFVRFVGDAIDDRQLFHPEKFAERLLRLLPE